MLKALTLLMYLGTVKHLSQELSTTLQVAADLLPPQDRAEFSDFLLLPQDGFSKEAQLRVKCVLQALMEQHALLTPATLTTIMMARCHTLTYTLNTTLIPNTTSPGCLTPPAS